MELQGLVVGMECQFSEREALLIGFDRRFQPNGRRQISEFAA